MTNPIQYSSTPDENLDAYAALYSDFVTGHPTVPKILRRAWISAMASTSEWLLGEMDFDQYMDKLGALADKLKEVDETRQIVSSN